MRIGVTFPQTAMGGDVGAVRAYAQAVDQLGYTHLLAYDHVVGADPAVHAGWDRAYDVDTVFHEPLVLLGYLAGFTSLELVTNVIILPQRQAVLVAKQAAEVDVLAEGRFRLGVGIGWNTVEYEALGMDFGNRGRRFEEQIALMRRLWTERSVTFEGRWDTVTGAGIAPLPVQRPIPLWIGANTPPALRRAARLADGWFPNRPLGPEAEEAVRIVREAAVEAGRDPDALAMEGRITLPPGPLDADALTAEVAGWEALGATHVGINTMAAGRADIDGHIELLAEAAAVVGLSPRGGPA